MQDRTVKYGAEIVTGGESGVPDTVVLVTDEELIVGPIAGKEDTAALSFDLGLSEIREVRCEGMFTDAIPIMATSGEFTIPTQGLDTVRFVSTLVDQAGLENHCERYGFGRTRFAVCKWSACLGAAMVIVGIGFSISMIGILLGLPLIGIGSAILLFAFGYKKLGDYMGDNVWTVPESVTA